MAFQPTIGAGVTMAGTAVNNNQAILATASPLASPNLEFVNKGPNAAAVRWGLGAQVAVYATDQMLLPNTTLLFPRGNADNVAIICTGAETATVIVTPGCGE